MKLEERTFGTPCILTLYNFQNHIMCMIYGFLLNNSLI